jgi:hypothetical protein
MYIGVRVFRLNFDTIGSGPSSRSTCLPFWCFRLIAVWCYAVTQQLAGWLALSCTRSVCAVCTWMLGWGSCACTTRPISEKKTLMCTVTTTAHNNNIEEASSSSSSSVHVPIPVLHLYSIVFFFPSFIPSLSLFVFFFFFFVVRVLRVPYVQERRA